MIILLKAYFDYDSMENNKTINRKKTTDKLKKTTDNHIIRKKYGE